MRALMKKDVQLFQKGSDTCWSAKFLTCMARIGLTDGKAVSEMRCLDSDTVCLMKFNEADVQKTLERIYSSFRDTRANDPRTATARVLSGSDTALGLLLRMTNI